MSAPILKLIAAERLLAEAREVLETEAVAASLRTDTQR